MSPFGRVRQRPKGLRHAAGVGQQNDLEQDLGMKGGCSALVVVVTCIKDRHIEMLVHHLAEGVLERARYQLIFLEWFAFCHRIHLACKTHRLG